MMKSLQLGLGAVGLSHWVLIACCWQGSVFIHTNDLRRLLCLSLIHLCPCPCLSWLAGDSVSFGGCGARYCCSCPCRCGVGPFLKDCLHKEYLILQGLLSPC